MQYKAMKSGSKLFKASMIRDEKTNMSFACQGCACSCDRTCLCCSWVAKQYEYKATKNGSKLFKASMIRDEKTRNVSCLSGLRL